MYTCTVYSNTWIARLKTILPEVKDLAFLRNTDRLMHLESSSTSHVDRYYMPAEFQGPSN